MEKFGASWEKAMDIHLDTAALARAKEKASEMLKTREELAFVPVGQPDSQAGVHISTDATKVIAIGSFEVEGHTFYVGPKSGQAAG